VGLKRLSSSRMKNPSLIAATYRHRRRYPALFPLWERLFTRLGLQ